MKSLNRLLLVIAFLEGVLGTGASALAQDKRFDPEKCFPLECLGYVHVRSGAGLATALSETLVGRIATDPEVHAALGKLPAFILDQMRANSAPLIELTGRDPLELLGLLRNELAISVTGIDPVAKLSVVVALELGAERDAILDVVRRIGAQITAGREPATVDIAGRKVTSWPILGGISSVHHLVLGTHLVFSSSSDVLRSVVETYDGTPGAGDFTLSGNPRYGEAREALSLEQPRLLTFLNVEAIRGLLLTFLSRDPGSKDMLKALQASGLLSVTTLGYALGSRDGDLEGKLLLGTGNGARGLLRDLFESLEAPADPARALPLIPAGASQAGAVAIDLGKLLRGVQIFLSEGLPQPVAQSLETSIKAVEERTGLSREKDLFTLGRIETTFFLIDPPAGGLIPDALSLIRTDAFQPYRALVEKLSRALAKEPLKLEPPVAPRGAGRPPVTYVRLGSVWSRLLGLELAPPPDGLVQAFIEPAISVAYADLEGGWTVVANSPQPVWRYLSSRGSAGDTRADGVAARFRQGFSGAKGFVVLRPSLLTLAAYNSLASLLVSFAPFAGEFLAPLEVDLGRLPPGEKFLGGLKEGFLRVDADLKGLRVHGHRVLSSAGGVLAPVAVVSAIAGFLIPTLTSARSRAQTVSCMSNLREIQKLGMIYADSAGTEAYPVSPKGGVAALQILVDFNDGLVPRIFICPESSVEPASREADGKFRLDEKHTSYDMVPWKLRPTDPPDRILAFDRGPYHHGGRNVVFLDGSVDFMKEAEFLMRYEEQRPRIEAPAGKPQGEKPAKTKTKKKDP